METAISGQSAGGSSISMRPPVPVEVVRASDLPYATFVTEYLRKNRPVVVDEAAPHWPAMSRWTPDYFRDKFGDETVQVSYTTRMRMAEFVDAVLASTERQPGPYLFRTFIHDEMPGLLPDLSPQNIYTFAGRYSSRLMPETWWRPDGYLKLLMGGPGSKFPVMHYDGDHAHAQITEIYGEKEFYLFPPEDSDKIYPRTVQRNMSQVQDPHAPDLERFPLMAQATPYRAVLRPGQTIFVPMLWWHAARPLSISISVCTNTLERSNWAGFVDDACTTPEGRPFKRLLKRAYFSGAGALMQAMEDFQTAAPALARAMKFPAAVSPASPHFAKDPSARRLEFRIPVA